MKIFFDLYHIPQYNLYRNTIKALGPEKVELGCVNRGRLVDIIKHECPDHRLFVFGDYKYNKGPFSMVTRIIVPRIYKLAKLFRTRKYDVVGTAHYQANAAARIAGIPNFSILDDPRSGVMEIVKLSADEFYLPPFLNGYENVRKFNALKEWSYLSPGYFQPNQSVLEEYHLNPKEYIFIREVSTETSNYLLQESNIILKLSDLFDGHKQVVLSLENKKLKEQYPSDWIILEEPVNDIHSIMYFSHLVISSGDSMAREGGMLGIPSIYLGARDMPANRILMEKGILFRKSVDEVADFIEDMNNGNIPMPVQEEFRDKLLNSWVDVNQMINAIVNRLNTN